MTDRGLLESVRRQAGRAASPEEQAERIDNLIPLDTGRRWVALYRLEAARRFGRVTRSSVTTSRTTRAT